MLVGDVPIGAGEAVQQRALPRVGVADERNGELIASGADLTLFAPGYLAYLALEVADAVLDDSPIDLDLSLARSARADAADGPDSRAATRSGDPLEVGPHAAKTGRRVLQLRQLDLQLGLAGLRP